MLFTRLLRQATEVSSLAAETLDSAGSTAVATSFGKQRFREKFEPGLANWFVGAHPSY